MKHFTPKPRGYNPTAPAAKAMQDLAERTCRIELQVYKRDAVLSFRAVIVLLCLLVGGCSGTKLLKEPIAQPSTPTLASACDAHVCVDIDWVIVRDGSGSWASKPDWDEYLLDVRNQSAHPVQITRAAVHDSTGYRIESTLGRAELAKGSKKTVRRYRDSGVRVDAGMGAGSMVVAGATVTTAGVGMAYAAAAEAASGAFAGGAGAGAGGLAAVAVVPLLIGPVLMVGGVVRHIDNGKVNDEILRRQTSFPIEIPHDGARSVDLFFSLAPSPSHLELVYLADGNEYRLSVDTRSALAGLHVASEKKEH